MDSSLAISTTIARPADAVYELFCAVERIPEWVRIVRSVCVRARDAAGRAQEVAYLATLDRGLIGYTLHYSYRPRDRSLSWTTVSDGRVQVLGYATFEPMGPRATLVTYDLIIARGGDALPAWSDPTYEAHAPSAALCDFRDFATRAL